jgi:hypothetical protein
VTHRHTWGQSERKDDDISLIVDSWQWHAGMSSEFTLGDSLFLIMREPKLTLSPEALRPIKTRLTAQSIKGRKICKIYVSVGFCLEKVWKCYIDYIRPGFTAIYIFPSHWRISLGDI